MKESGKIMICKDWGSTNGMTAECIKDSTKTIRRTGMVYIAGKIKDSIRDIG
jgi:hypothetical protein